MPAAVAKYVSLCIAKICLGKSKICYFSLQILTQENVVGLHITVNYWQIATFVQIIQAFIYHRKCQKMRITIMTIWRICLIPVFLMCFVAAYLVQLQALLVHVSSSSRLQKHHFYLQCFNITEQFKSFTCQFQQIYGMFPFPSFDIIFYNGIAI